MITSVPSICLLPDVRGHGAVSLLTSHITKGECTVVACHINKVRGGSTSLEQPAWQGPDARQRRSWLGEWAATELHLNMTTACARSRQTAAEIYSGWAAIALCVCRPGKLPVG